MKTFYSCLLGVCALLVLGSSQRAHAQTVCPTSPAECVVDWDLNGDFVPEINALRDAIANDTDRPEDRVYVLKRGGLYWNEDRIVNDGFDLRLHGQTAEEGQTSGENVCGPGGNEDCGPALIQRFVRGDGTVDAVMIESSNGGGHDFKNLWLMGQDNTGITANYEPIVINSSDAMLVYDTVIFDRNDWHHLGVKGTGNEAYFRNCTFRNLVGNTQRYEGRGIRFENGGAKAVFENNTFFNITSFPFQSEAAPVDYVLFNHNTLVNFGLAFNAGGIWKAAFVANNLMINPFFQGESADLYEQPNRADPFSGVFGVSTLPARFGLEGDRRIALANNGYWRNPDLEAYYATFDPVVRAQPLVNDSTQQFFNLYDGMVNQGNIALGSAPGFASAPLTTEVYDAMFDFVNSVSTGGATPFALVEWDPGRPDNPLAINWPLPEDFSYSNGTLESAATDGLPLGDLNWFPADKATYLASRDQFVMDIEELTGAPPEEPIGTDVVQAETGALAGGAAIETVDGFTSIFFESGGFAEWTFNVPSDGTYGLNINTDLRGSDPRGERVTLDGNNLRNTADFGELFFCTAAWTGGTCPQPLATADGFTVMELRQANLVNVDDTPEDDTEFLTLTAGSHTLRIQPVWGYQAFAEIEVVDAGGNVVTTLTPPDATTEGVIEECEDDAAYCPQGFKTVSLPSGASVSFGFPVPAGGMSITGLLYYTSESGGTGEVLVDGTSAGTLVFNPTAAGASGNVVTSRVNAPGGGTSTVAVQTTAGEINLDYALFLTYANAATGLEDLPEGWSLGDIYPNPSTQRAAIRFRLAETADIQLEVFDVLGRKVSTLAEGAMAAGPHEATLPVADLASGTYVLRLVTPVGTQTRRLTVVR